MTATSWSGTEGIPERLLANMTIDEVKPLACMPTLARNVSHLTIVTSVASDLLTVASDPLEPKN